MNSHRVHPVRQPSSTRPTSSSSSSQKSKEKKEKSKCSPTFSGSKLQDADEKKKKEIEIAGGGGGGEKSGKVNNNNNLICGYCGISIQGGEEYIELETSTTASVFSDENSCNSRPSSSNNKNNKDSAVSVIYHTNCLYCGMCGELIDHSQTMFSKGVPFHVECISEKCVKCGEIILPSAKFWTLNSNQHYHTSCLLCSTCGFPITEGQMTLDRKKRPNHAECIVCCYCRLPLKKQQNFHPYWTDLVMCSSCADNLPRCCCCERKTVPYIREADGKKMPNVRLEGELFVCGICSSLDCVMTNEKALNVLQFVLRNISTMKNVQIIFSDLMLVNQRNPEFFQTPISSSSFPIRVDVVDFSQINKIKKMSSTSTPSSLSTLRSQQREGKSRPAAIRHSNPTPSSSVKSNKNRDSKFQEQQKPTTITPNINSTGKENENEEDKDDFYHMYGRCEAREVTISTYTTTSSSPSSPSSSVPQTTSKKTAASSSSVPRTTSKKTAGSSSTTSSSFVPQTTSKKTAGSSSTSSSSFVPQTTSKKTAASSSASSSSFVPQTNSKKTAASSSSSFCAGRGRMTNVGNMYKSLEEDKENSGIFSSFSPSSLPSSNRKNNDNPSRCSSTSSPLVSVRHVRVVERVVVVKGLPFSLFAAHLGHEITHAYLWLLTPILPKLAPEIEEGICNVIAAKILQLRIAQLKTESELEKKNSLRNVEECEKNQKMRKEKKESAEKEIEICQFRLYKMENCLHPHYGVGYRNVRPKLEKWGLKKIIDELRRSGKLLEADG